jgi:hypothetical protein
MVENTRLPHGNLFRSANEAIQLIAAGLMKFFAAPVMKRLANVAQILIIFACNFFGGNLRSRT